MEHICDNCKNSEDITDSSKIPCKLGFIEYYECKVACTEDYFERKTDKT